MNSANICQTAIMVLLIIVLSACVGTTPRHTLDAGQSLAIAQPVIKRADSAVASKAQRAGTGMLLGAVGAAGGAALGGSMGGMFGMACGPAAIICVPIGLAAGAGIGGVGGGLVGATAGGVGGITGSKADAFNQIADRIMDPVNLESQLHEQVSASAGQYWQLQDDSPNTLTLEVTSLRFRQPGDEMIQLDVCAKVYAKFAGQLQTIKIEQRSIGHHVDYWLAAEGMNFQAEVDAAIQQIAATMVSRMVTQTESLARSPRIASLDPSARTPAL